MSDKIINSDFQYISRDNQPSCLDSPTSLVSPTFCLPSVMSLNKFSILRKLGAAEAIYDYEHSIGNLILSHSFKISSKIDLFKSINKVNESVWYWKNMHSLLRARILTVETGEKYCSSEKYFAYASDETIRSNNNVKYFHLNNKDGNNSVHQIDKYWSLIYDREYNIEFVDSINGLLWRIIFLQSDYDIINKEFKYYILFTTHHAIADARNVFTMIQELLEIIENVNLNQFKFIPNYEIYNHVEPSIEEKLFHNDEKILSQVPVSSTISLTKFNKIPENFASSKKLLRQVNGELVSVIDNQIISLNSLIEESQTVYETRTKCFVINDELFKQLVNKCKMANTKLTGCFNMITALSTRLLYLHYSSDPVLLKIQYHILVNLRPLLHPPLDNNLIGYWAVVLSTVIDLENFYDNDIEWSKRFWNLAKQESDSIHNRIKRNEHIEAAKFDSTLLKDINLGVTFENGGVHFALSNLGIMKLNTKSNNLIKIEEHYFGTSCQKDRWSAVVFHGLTTIENHLCWSITYNSKLLSENVINHLVKLIIEILNKVITVNSFI